MCEKKKGALLVIDMEEAFLNEKSPLYIAQAAATVPTLGEVVAYARKQEIPVFFVNRVYRANGSDVEACRYENWLKGGRCLAPESTGPCSVEVPAKLEPKAGDYTIIKPRFSAFFHTELDLILRRLQVDTVILTGTTTPNCIRSTCYDGLSLDYNVVILEDCCSSRNEAVQKANMEDMAFIGAEILDAKLFMEQGLSGKNVVQSVKNQVEQDKTPPE